MIKKVVLNFFGLQFLRFVLVGVLNTIFGYSVFALFTKLGLNYVFSLLLATIAGSLFNFRTIGFFVFKSKNNSLIWRFLLVYLMVFIINVLPLKYLRISLGNDYLAQGILAPIVAVFSFSLNKIFVYKNENEKTII